MRPASTFEVFEMIITIQEVKEILLNLMQNTITRESAEAWAIVRRNASDLGELEYSLKSDEERIWNAIQFIELFAEKVDIGVYLYDETDLRDYIDSIGFRETENLFCKSE